MKHTKWIAASVIIAVSLSIYGGASLSQYAARSNGDSRERAEFEHGVLLPPSAVDIQCRGDGWLRVTPLSGGGATAMFEMSPGEIPAFMAPLHVRSRSVPVIATGDPTVNGFNVWSEKSKTWIPGNTQFGGFQRTWDGSAVPLEMVSCDSPEGMWLHLEFWKLDDSRTLVKMGTMWQD